MHSPPVQPSSSSTSGTGSVITMWLEVTVSRRRSGRWPASAAPVASTAAGRARGPDRSAPRRPAPLAGAAAGPASPRRCVTPRSREPRAKAEREPRRLHGGGAGVEGPGAKERRVAAGPHLGLRQRAAGAGNAQLGAGVGDRPPGAVVRRSRRDLEVAARAVPGVDPLLLAPAPDPLDRVLRRPRRPRARRRRRSALEAPAG